jgi:hypothetical protein
MSLTFVQGDNRPNLIGTLTYPTTGDPVDLTGCTVVFQMRKENDRRYTVNALATVISPLTGQVRYDWSANDLAVPGEYQAQFEITFGDATHQTSDPPETLIVRRQ